MNEHARDDCFFHDSNRLSYADALRLLRERISPVARKAACDLHEADGRVLAADIVAPRDIPLHDNSAVDGYSFSFANYDPDGGSSLPVIGRIAAGRGIEQVRGLGARDPGAIRIFTGAEVPPAHDTVVMQEDVSRQEVAGAASISIPAGLKRGANVRPAGEDVAAGGTVAAAGTRLRPQDLAAIASAGEARPICYEPLKVALFSTGDEVVEPGSDLEMGQVFDANSAMLRALISKAGASVDWRGTLADDQGALAHALGQAVRHNDVIITSGGASQGEEDHLATTLDRLGKRHLWQIAIKPGRPIMFGQIGETIVIALPGNPVAVFVCFILFAWPLLHRLGGAGWPEPMGFDVPAGFRVASKKPGRREFWRAWLERRDGGVVAIKFPSDGSGLISSLTGATGLIEIDEETRSVQAGQPVRFIPFSQFGIF